MEALTQGVPQVAIPITNDQPGVAARIAAHQTGVVTSLEDLTVSHLSTLVAEVLNNSKYSDNARKFQQAIAKTNGLSRAADLLEEAFGLTAQKWSQTLAIPLSKSGYRFRQLVTSRTPSAAIARRRNTVAGPNE